MGAQSPLLPVPYLHTHPSPRAGRGCGGAGVPGCGGTGVRGYRGAGVPGCGDPGPGGGRAGSIPPGGESTAPRSSSSFSFFFLQKSRFFETSCGGALTLGAPLSCSGRDAALTLRCPERCGHPCPRRRDWLSLTRPRAAGHHELGGARLCLPSFPCLRFASSREVRPCWGGGSGGLTAGLGCRATPGGLPTPGGLALWAQGLVGTGRAVPAGREGPVSHFGCCTTCTASFRARGTAQGDIVSRRNSQSGKGVSKAFP